MAASEAMEATEVKNNLKNGLFDLKYRTRGFTSRGFLASITVPPKSYDTPV